MEYLGCLICLNTELINTYLIFMLHKKAEIPSFHRTDESWCDGTKVDVVGYYLREVFLPPRVSKNRLNDQIGCCGFSYMGSKA